MLSLLQVQVQVPGRPQQETTDGSAAPPAHGAVTGLRKANRAELCRLDVRAGHRN